MSITTICPNPDCRKEFRLEDGAVGDDKSLEKAERKRLQIVNAPKKSPEAKCVKIADKTCNLSSIISDPPNDWSIQRQREYFDWAERVIVGLLGVNDSLDAYVKEVLARGKAALETLAANSIQND